MSYHSFFSRPLSLKILNKLNVQKTLVLKLKLWNISTDSPKTPSMQDKQPEYQIVKVHH